MRCIKTYMPIIAVKGVALMIGTRKNQAQILLGEDISIKVFRGVPTFLQVNHGIMPHV